MGDLVVELEDRTETGKNAARRLRASGRIPCVVYGHDFDTLSVAIDPKEVLKILQSETGHNTIFKVKIKTTTADVLIRDYQLDPIKGTLMHADFQTIAMDEVLEFEVPVGIDGVPAGVKNDGGTLDIVLREITLECLPGDVPDHIHVDVRQLQIGDSIRVSDLKVDTTKIKLLSDPDLVVLTVVPPHVEAEPEAVPVAAEAAEPEVIRKGKAEEEEGES